MDSLELGTMNSFVIAQYRLGRTEVKAGGFRKTPNLKSQTPTKESNTNNPTAPTSRSRDRQDITRAQSRRHQPRIRIRNTKIIMTQRENSNEVKMQSARCRS